VRDTAAAVDQHTAAVDDDTTAAVDDTTITTTVDHAAAATTVDHAAADGAAVTPDPDRLRGTAAGDAGPGQPRDRGLSRPGSCGSPTTHFRPTARRCDHAGTVEEVGVDVRNVQEVEPEVEHNGTVPVWWLIHPREMKDLTDGGYLELANEFEVGVGGEVFPHTHPTHEFYFMMTGTGVMTIGGEQREVVPGDLIYIPPDQVHSLRTTSDSAIRCFCFAVGVKGAGPIDYTTH